MFLFEQHFLHCDNFLPLVTLGVNIGQLEFEFESHVEYLQVYLCQNR